MRVIVDFHNTRKSYSVGRANAEFYIGGSTFLCQFIEPITFARCAFIFAWWNNTLGGYLDTHEHLRHESTAGNIPIYNYTKVYSRSVNPRKLRVGVKK